MTAVAGEWREYARKLSSKIAADGVVRDPAWSAALEAVPRHVFVPHFYQQRSDGEWAKTSSGDAGWLETVYSDTPLVTALAQAEDGRVVTVSSSTKPGLMVRMLEALDLQAGQRVLEIGTGTGYNAGLLTHRLGEKHVFSVDIDTELLNVARTRLALLDYAPTLVATHGAAGLPEGAPFDRIIATCSVPAVPRAWSEQVRDGGFLLVDVKRGVHAGNLALLQRIGDRLEGRFLPKWAGFMAIRGTDGPPPKTRANALQPAHGARSTTRLDPQPWASPLPWFLAQSRLPQHIAFGYRGSDPQWATFFSDDGSWCAVTVASDEEGIREVRQAGPVAIWDQFENAHKMWDKLGRPGWDRLGLTVQHDGHHRVWLGSPGGPYHWSLPPVA